jgi:Ca2+-binding RTX toxin-like protein
MWSRDGAAIFVASLNELWRIALDAAGQVSRVGAASYDAMLAPDGTGYAYTATGECGDRVGIYVRRWSGVARRITNDCNVYGTPRRDRLETRTDLYEIVNGQGGDDTLTVGGAPYVGGALRGGTGNDILRGSYWPDSLDGGAGADVLYGGVNRDELIGGSGRDRLYGQGGTDRIYARDGRRDVVDCGANIGRTNKTPELDKAYVDRFDVVSRCEHVFRSN